jgi:hypothetical protein
MIPNIKENPRNRKRTKRGHKRFFNAAMHALRTCVDRTFGWRINSSECHFVLNTCSHGTLV